MAYNHVDGGTGTIPGARRGRAGADRGGGIAAPQEADVGAVINVPPGAETNGADAAAAGNLMVLISQGCEAELEEYLDGLLPQVRRLALTAHTRDGDSLITAAVRGGLSRAVAALLKHGANPYSRLKSSGNTAAHVAAMAGDLGALRALLDGAAAAADPGADQEQLATTPNYNGDTPLLFACAASGPSALAVCALLMNRGADPNQANRSGLTPAMVAASNGDALVLRALLKCAQAAGVETLLCAHDEHGNTPLAFASRGGHAECVRALLDAAAIGSAAATVQLFSRNAAGRTALDEARLARSRCVVALLEAAAKAACAEADAAAEALLRENATQAAAAKSRVRGRGKKQPRQPPNQQQQQQQQEAEEKGEKEEDAEEEEEEEEEQQQQQQKQPKPAQHANADTAVAGPWTAVRGGKGRRAPESGGAPAAAPSKAASAARRTAAGKPSPPAVQQQQQQQKQQQPQQQQPSPSGATAPCSSTSFSWAKVVCGSDGAGTSGSKSADNAHSAPLLHRQKQQHQRQQPSKQQQQQQHQGPEGPDAADEADGGSDAEPALSEDAGPESQPGWLDAARACIADLCPSAPALAISPAHVLGLGLADLSAAQLEAVEAVHRGALTRVAEARAALAAAAAEAHVAERARLAGEIARLRSQLGGAAVSDHVGSSG